MAIEKQVIQKGNRCKVKFSLPKELAESAKTAYLVGDFNNWDPRDIPMKKTKDGSYTVSIRLEAGKDYQFRYLLDNHRWENELHADKYVPSGFGNGVNSVLST
jgi:1,4-alpha-glucan branching enzyme